MKRLAGEIFILSTATLIIAAAVYFFLLPSHASIASISGLAMVLSRLLPLPVSLFTMLMNGALLMLGFALLGRGFGIRTVYTSMLLPFYLWIFETLLPNQGSLTGSDILDAVCYLFTVSLGLAVLFNNNASSGGLDIVAKLMNRFLHIELGHAMSISGMVVALSSALVSDSRTVVISVLGTYLNGLVLDHFILGQNIKKRVCIVSEDFEAVRSFIINELCSGATVYDACGAYNMQPHREIITVVDKGEYQRLMLWIEKNAPDAFITVYNVSDMRYRPKPKPGRQ